MSSIRLFLSTVILVTCLFAVVLWLFPIVIGRYPLTLAGFFGAFHAIRWETAFSFAALFGVIRVLSQFEFFNRLYSLFYWLDVAGKALASWLR